MTHCSVVVWDDIPSKLVGVDARTQSKDQDDENADEDDEDEDGDEDEDDDESDNAADDAEVEPDASADEPAELSDISFEYNPRDPVGLQLGKLSMNDATRYHLVKSACEKAGRLEEWKRSLGDTVIELSLVLSTQSLTNARSKKAVKKILQELQHYVCLPTYWDSTC
jgi:hypothetical protein